MQPETQADQTRVFEAPSLFVALFYGILLVWTVGTIPPIYWKFQRGGFGGDWAFAAMIAFFYLYTWYWALGLCYRIRLDREGRIHCSSLRRTWEVTAKEVRAIEGSKLPSGFGFVRIKLPRESAYLFCPRLGEELGAIVREIRRVNPLVRTARI